MKLCVLFCWLIVMCVMPAPKETQPVVAPDAEKHGAGELFVMFSEFLQKGRIPDGKSNVFSCRDSKGSREGLF